jgi:hypothetical protein
MNNLSATDIMLFGALFGALALIVLAGLWALAHRGRKRWTAERADRVVADGMRILKAGAGDIIVITYPGHLTREQGRQIMEAMERKLPKGVKAMLMDGGMRMSHVVTASEAAIS